MLQIQTAEPISTIAQAASDAARRRHGLCDREGAEWPPASLPSVYSYSNWSVGGFFLLVFRLAMARTSTTPAFDAAGASMVQRDAEVHWTSVAMPFPTLKVVATVPIYDRTTRRISICISGR